MVKTVVPSLGADRSFWRQRRVFVTGATGLLGSHLTRYLLDNGAEVIALVRDSVPRSLFFSDDEAWQLNKRAICVRGQIEDAPLLDRIINEYEIDSVFHLAAQTIVGVANHSPAATFHANIGGTWNLLEACRNNAKRLERVVIASSDKAYGDLKGEAYDEAFPLQGSHPYDVSKSCADLIAQAYARSYGLPVAITRCGNFFGAGDLNFSRLVPGTIRHVVNDERPIIRSNGQFIRDYIFVEDGVDAYITLAEAMTLSHGKVPFAGEAFNFSYGLRLRAVDVVEQILKTMHSNLTPDIRNEANNEIPVQCLDSTKAKEHLRWRPRYGFQEGMAMTIDWYRKLLSETTRRHSA